MKWYVVLLIVVLVPVGAYLREQTYKYLHGRSTMGEDIKHLFQRITKRSSRTKNNQ